MRDAGLVGYVDAIERYLARMRGTDHVLTPPDFALARSWFEAGIALGNVLSALDEAAARGPISSLSACRKRVEGTATGPPG
jgi:hypothetical protein